MERILEPELMDDMGQAMAYADADFEEPHSRVIELFKSEFPGAGIKGHILDLGCGPGDMTFRFAYLFPESRVTGVDGSAAMIELANKRKKSEKTIADRVVFIEGALPGAPVPRTPYSLIVSNSLLHHLHNPDILWKSILEYSSPGTKIFVVDLLRPGNREEAGRIVEQYSVNEPEILKRDFYNSLLAAFRPEEVERQLSDSGLSELSVRVVSDRHLLVSGEKS